MAMQVVTYQVGDTRVRFEAEPPEGFHPAGGGQVIAKVREAVEPAVEAAKAVLDRVKEARPDQVEVRFGVKVSGAADWIVARSAGEASFEIALTWLRDAGRDSAGPESPIRKLAAGECPGARPGR